MYISNYFAGSPIYDETLSKFRNKAKENSRQAFNDFISKNEDGNKEQAVQVTSGESENMIADNGVKSTLLLGRLDSQNTGSMSTINLTDEELEGWNNGKIPEGWRQTNAGGVIFSGGTRAYDNYFNVYYTDGAEHDYQFGVFYDENSPEDNPVVYLRKIEASTSSELNGSETIRIEVSKVNPSNATYEEMIALAGYIYRDDPKAAREACDAVDMARFAMEADGLDWQNSTHDYMSYYLPEAVRRYKEYDPELSEAAESLLEYLKDYPRGSDEA
ncbi:MAG: hypothetical protein IJR43_06715 [Synergistaceae bacterium]|nr:hypothetical protein [Synergistaceae bacterium]